MNPEHTFGRIAPSRDSTREMGVATYGGLSRALTDFFAKHCSRVDTGVEVGGGIRLFSRFGFVDFGMVWI